MAYDDDSGRGPIFDIAAMGAIGYAAFPFFNNRNSLKQSISDTSIDKLSSFANRSPGFNTLANVRNAAEMNVNPYLSGFAQEVSPDILKRDIYRFSYEASMVGRKFGATDIRAGLSPILEQEDPFKAYGFAAEKIKEMGGDVSLLQRRIVERAEKDSFKYMSSVEDAYSRAVVADPITNIRKSYRTTSLQDLKNVDQYAYQQAVEFEKMFMPSPGDKLSGKHPMSYYTVKDVMAGKEVETPMARISIGKERVEVPLSKRAAFAYGGKDFTTRYTPREFYTPEGEILSQAEGVRMKLKSMAEISEESLRAVNSTLSPTAKQMLDEAKSSQIWTVPEPAMTAGGRARSRMIMNEAIPLMDMTQDEISSVIGEGTDWASAKGAMRGSLLPYTSPSSAAKGTMMTKDMPRSLFGAYGAFVSPEERPLQYIRSEWGATQSAKNLAVNRQMKSMSNLDRLVKGPEYEKYMYGKYAPASAEAYSNPQLMSFYAKTKGDEFASPALNRFMALEEGLVGRSAKDMLKYERTVPMDIDISPGMDVNRDVINKLRREATIGKVITPDKPIGVGSEFLGIEKETGRELYTSIGGGKRSITNMELTSPTSARLYMREEIGIEDAKFLKMFSEENKFVMGLERKGELMGALSAAKAPSGIRNDVEAIMSAKLVQKRKMSLLNQQTEAMGYFLQKNIAANKLSARKRVQAKSFLADPIKHLGIEDMVDESNLTKSFADIEGGLVGFAKKMGLEDEQMQLTFGAMDEGIAKNLGIAETVAKSPGVIGASKMNLGALVAEGGAGGMATAEQSALRLATLKGDEGVMFADELASRMVDSQAISETDLMASTALGQAEKKVKDATNLADLSDDALIQSKGRYVDLGRKVKEFGGASQLYIPGTEKAPSIMAQFRSQETGELMDTDLVSSLRGLQGAIATDDQDKIEAAAKNFREQAFLASERTAAPRGKVFGTRFLGAIRRDTAQEGVISVSTRDARNMMDEMIERSQSEAQKKYLQEKKAKILSGEDFHGAAWRFPTTGPESMQYGRFRVDKNLTAGTVAIPGRTGTLAIKEGNEIIQETIDMSQMAGMKGDFDDDKIAISFIGNKSTEARVKAKVEGSLDAEYNNYLFRHNVLKREVSRRKVSESTKEMSRQTMIAAGHRKNTLADRTTGRINLALQKVKMGLQHKSPDEYRPLAEAMFHMEEAAIGGKHGALGEQVYEDIVGGIETGGAKGKKQLAGALESLFGPKRTVSGAVESSGKSIKSSLAIDPKGWAETMVGASDSIKDEASAAVLSSRVAKNAPSAKHMDLPEMQRVHNLRKQAQVDASQRIMQERADNVIKDKSTKAMQKTGRAKNTLLEIASANKKTVGLGLAAAAAVMMFAPSISGSISPEGVQSGANLTPDMMGNTSISQMPIHQAGLGESPKVYDMPGIQHTNRANIRMKMSDYNDRQRDVQEDAQSLSNYGNVRLRTVDDRSFSDHFSLSRQIEERL